MEDVLSPTEKQSMVSSFLEFAVGESSDIALQFLQATSWKLQEAIQLFYVGNEGVGVGSSSFLPPQDSAAPPSVQNFSDLGRDAGLDVTGLDGGDDVRPPLPVIREALYDDAVLYGARSYSSQGSTVVAFQNFQEHRDPGVLASGQGGTSTAERPQNKLAARYRPPFELMHQVPFEKAKLAAAAAEDKWLLANLQSTTEFTSHMVYDNTSEGKKVCTYYKVESAPVVLIIDPITGQKIRSWSGMIHPDRLLEDLLPFMDSGPKNHHTSFSHKRPRECSNKPAQKVQGMLDAGMLDVFQYLLNTGILSMFSNPIAGQSSSFHLRRM